MAFRHRACRALGFVTALPSGAAAAQEIRLCEHADVEGRSFSAQGAMRDFERARFNDVASSIVVRRGPWEVRSDARFGGRCVRLRPGRHRNLQPVDLNDAVASVRPARRGPRPDRSRPR